MCYYKPVNQNWTFFLLPKNIISQSPYAPERSNKSWSSTFNLQRQTKVICEL